MASVADATCGVGEFGQWKAVPIASPSPRADVLAQLDRLVVPDLYPTPSPRKFRIFVGDTPIDFPYTTGNSGLPSWAEPVFRSLASNWGAQQGWDSYKAKPTDPNLVVRLLNILSAAMADNSRPPQMTPLADGGMQAEWHEKASDLEIVVPSNELPRYYFFDHVTSDEEEDTLNASRVRELIRKL